MKEALQALIDDKRYWNDRHPEHEAYRAFVAQEFKRAYPGLHRPTGLEPMGGAGGPGLIHVRSYEQVRDGQLVQVAEHQRGGPGAGQEAKGGSAKGLPTMTNPVSNGKKRGCDGRPYGCGHYEADRDGGRKHKGVDIAVEPGQDVHSPVTGTVEGPPFDPYGSSNDMSKRGKYKAVSIRTEDGHLVRVMYIDPDVKSGQKVEAAKTRIGTSQDLSKIYPPVGNTKMTNHVHIDVQKKGEFKDPTQIIFGK
ncbi:MAG: M23 family metallopeptidase [Alphaproteobacteria bacterium]|nr:M23 family metallopeptidase [Alphaproteobacteria bacterium]